MRPQPRPWWDEPAYEAARGSFSTKGTFILDKLAEYEAVRPRPYK
jgi:hypothetical protein